MPAPLPPDQLTIIRNLIAKGDTAGAIKVYAEATGATAAEAKTEVNNLAARYGLVGAQVPDLFVRRAAPKPPLPAEAPAAPAVPPPAPAPVAHQEANVPIEPAAPAPAPVPPPPPAAPTPRPPAPAAPAPAPVPVRAAVPVSVPKPQASPASTAQPAPKASTPSAQKSRWGCSSVFVFFGGVAGVAWWVIG